MNLLGSFDIFVAIYDDAGIIISLFYLFYLFKYNNNTLQQLYNTLPKTKYQYKGMIKNSSTKT